MTSSPACPPRWSSPRRADRPTWGPHLAKIADALGKPLMPWQQHAADVALEVNPDTGALAYREVRLTVPRQSGKSTLGLALAVWRLAAAQALGGRQTIVFTAQTRNKAREKFVDDYLEELRAAKRLKGRWRERLSNGSESIRWENGSRWGIESSTEKAGHGTTLDLGWIDEAFAQVDDRLEQAMKPAMITRPQPQLWVVSTAGTDSSTYLNGKVDTGREFADAGYDTGVAYFEWSALQGADPGDPATWRSCIPSLGHTVTEDAIAADFKSMKLPEFCRAYLNWRTPKSYGEQAIDADPWSACEDPASQIDGNRVVFAVDVAPGSAWASLCVAGYRADGLPHLEVIDHRAGDGWVVDRLVQLRERYRSAPVVLDPAGPVGALLPDLRRAGFEPVTMTGRDMAQACTALKSAVEKDRRVRHLGQDVLTDALAGAATRQLLDAWAWRRTSSSADITSLVGVTAALWGLASGLAGEDYDLMTSFG